MADIFISYKREERAAVERLATELRALGLSVWFDASLSAGETFSDEIDREARAAKAILVCWSPAARTSDWVKAEALIGFTNKTLAACYVAGPNGFDPPAPFNATHAEDLRAWLAAPSAAHAGWKSLLRRIGRLCGRADIESYGALDVQASAAALRAWLAQHDASPLFMTVDALLRARDAEDAERARLEQEARDRRAREEADRARQEAERQAAEAEARRREAERQAAEAEARRLAEAREAERRAEEKARAEEQKQRAAAAGRKWLAPAGAAGVALVALLVWSPWNQGEQPVFDAAPIEAAQTLDEAPESAPSVVETAPALPGPFVDARSTPASVRAPVVSNPAGLPDFALFRECNDCPEMVVIPAGFFLMGSPAGEAGRAEVEDSRSGAGGAQVSLGVPRFAISRFETTWDEWDACVRASVCQQGPVDARGDDVNWGRGRRPVINVDWTDAGVFARWVNGRASVSAYRRPTEAEWEYAARAGTTTRWSFGDAESQLGTYAWFTGNSGERSQPVGGKAVNPWGLFDMHGNVWEWVEDCYRRNLSGQTAAAYTTGGCTSRVFRGGSWDNNPQSLRSAFRIWNTPSNRFNNLGFRLARTL